MASVADEHTECVLLPGIFGMFVQGLLFLASVAVLIFKKKREERLERLGRPGIRARNWATFLLDSSKQLIGSGWVHVVNLFCASTFGQMTEGDGCQWYWVNIMVDTTLGVGIVYLLLWGLTRAFEALTGHKKIFKSGDYKDESGQMIPLKYFSQLGVWLLCVTLMKLFVALMMLIFRGPMAAISGAFLNLFPDSSKFRLVVVMVITPVCMNAMQLWITDHFIKATDKPEEQSLHGQREEARTRSELGSFEPQGELG